MARARILLLAGTGEARELAICLVEDPRFAVTASLAGAVAAPTPLPVPVRSGGFGGVPGLEAYLQAQRIDAVVDATHPFAVRMSANAVAACTRLGVPLLRLERPPWRQQPGDRWLETDSVRAAAMALPAGARAFLTIGRQELSDFAARTDIWCLMRMIDPPSQNALLPVGKTVFGRPAATADAEADLMREHRISHLVTKNSGGPSDAKLAAARRLGLPVVMVARPAAPVRGAIVVTSVADALHQLRRLLDQP